MSALTGQEAIDHVKTMPAKQPGTEGFWEVWGARPHHLRPGDILVSKVRGTDEVEIDFVADLFPAKSPARQGFVNQDAEQFTVGILSPVVILRWGTHGTLA
jgi:hypothetical protein